jgi:predicted RNase H-like HicB family nuclease
MTGHAIIIEGAGTSYSAYAPELPGCVATGNSVALVEKRMREAIWLHIELMEATGDAVPPPTTVATAIAEVAAAP